ncbi:MAG: tetratricopeptide repeat protein [Bdellovibrionia bacterium]
MNTKLGQFKTIENLVEALQIPTLVVLAIGVVTTTGYLGLKHRALVLAEKYEAKGFGALALDTLEPFKKGLVSSERGCKAILNAAFQTKKIDQLEWGAQACLNSEIKIPETFLAYASVFEFTGRDGEAINLLLGVAEQFPKVPDLYFRVGQILQRNKRPTEAGKAYQKAFAVTPDNVNLALEVLQNLSIMQLWADAKPVAERLKPLKTDNPVIKLLIARTFLRTGDQGTAKQLTAEADELLKKNPGAKAELEKNFADLFQPESVVATNKK